MAHFNFDPKSAKTASELKRQIASSWGGDEEDEGSAYAVVDDCGPCVVAAFAHQHHAERFVEASGEDMYLCNAKGEPIED